ncbi:MAG TPA: cysteine desulfurase family protein [Bryobacteraceae bacterium]|nr:cysteine desulfurase family protein [Bryobacteraceae bacterium]
MANSCPAITVKLINEVRRYYFDHNATTPVSQSVLEVLVAALLEVPGNASSIHQDGQIAKQRLEMARQEVATLLGCESKELVFTSGGTEADNLAILGSVLGNVAPHKHAITTAVEHPAVLNPFRELERSGIPVTYLLPGPDGVIDPGDVRRALRPETALVSVMHANNETGALQPVAEIAAIAHQAGALVHSDGVQAAGKIPIDVEALGVDLYSISGHKFYATKGIGALYVKAGTKLRPIQFGGKHERERRPGTENVPSAVAMGKAAAIARSTLSIEPARMEALRDRLETGILARVPDAGVNAENAARTPNTTNIYFDGLEGEALVISLDLKGFAVSSGSACSSGAVEPSHVLLAMGLPPERARASLRFSLGHSNNEEQVDALIDAVVGSVAQLRKLSPTYTSV